VYGLATVSYTVRDGPAAAGGTMWNFEGGTLDGWTPTGTAFEFQPTLDDNPTGRNRGQPANQQGRYWIGT